MNTYKQEIDFKNLSGIYKIESPNKRIYIGQSVNIRSRILSYFRLECKGQKRLYNSFIKYGVNNHIFSLIEYCDIENLNERERYWQDYFNALFKKGLNCRLTSNNDRSGRMSKETVCKATRTRKIKNSACKIVYQYNKLGKLLNTFTSSRDCAEALNLNRKSILCCLSKSANLRTYKGFVFSYYILTEEEVINKYHKTRKKGIKHSKETKDKMSKQRLKKKIKSINLETKEIIRFNNIHEVASYFNLDKNLIYPCCLNYRKLINNIKFEYYE